ncbi:MAG: hypothetical protein AAGB18_01940 [Pseudomonadota bacterium]
MDLKSVMPKPPVVFALGLLAFCGGLFLAIPHLLFAMKLGLSLCLNGAGVTSLAVMLSGPHCSGCLVALVGAAVMVFSRVGHTSVAAGRAA